MRKRVRTLVSLAALAVVVAIAAAETRASDKSATAGVSDLTGSWVIDRSRSDAPPQRGGNLGHWGGGGAPDGATGGGHGGGGYGGHGHGTHSDSGGGHDGATRPQRLPMRFHATQTSSVVSFEDSTGAVVQEIATVSAAADTFTRAPGAAHWLGTWKDGKLIVAHDGPRGSKLTETWSLEDKGASLVSLVEMKGGDMPERTFKRVYRRVSDDQ